MYYEETFKVKGFDSISFKIDKINPNEHLTIVFAVTQTSVSKDLDFNDKANDKMLSKIKWNKTGEAYHPLLNTDGSARLPELESSPILLIHLLNEFRKRVVDPVFTE